jgi:hypothetical protein
MNRRCVAGALTTHSGRTIIIAAIADVALRLRCRISQPVAQRLGVSYCEIRAVGSVGLLPRIAMTSADWAATGLQNASISRCETHSGLCDRLKYAVPSWVQH